MSKFGFRLKELRERNNLTLIEMAESIGSSNATLSRYENGINEATADIVKKIAIKFKVSMDWLMGISDDENMSIIQMSQIPELKGIAEGYIQVAQEAYNLKLTPSELSDILRLIGKAKRK